MLQTLVNNARKYAIPTECLNDSKFKLSELLLLLDNRKYMPKMDLRISRPAKNPDIKALKYKNVIAAAEPIYTEFSNLAGDLSFKNKVYDRFQNNDNLKNGNARTYYTDEMKLEFVRCANDPLYFARNYVNIITLDDGLVKYQPRWYQEQLIYDIHNNRNIIALQSRQTGKTTVAAIYIVWFMLFHGHKNIALTGKTLDGAIEIMDRVKLIVEYLPEFLSPGITKWSADTIEFENGSKAVALPANNKLRGRSLALVYADEFAFVNDNATFFKKVLKPTISSGKKSKIILTSTPNGYETFAEIYHNAVAGNNSFKAFTVDWKCIHERLFHNGKFDNGAYWKMREIADIGRLAFLVEQENDFTSSISTLIDPSVLDKLEAVRPIDEQEYDYNGKKIYLREYAEYKEGQHIAIFCDPASGVGKDYTAIVAVCIETSSVILTLRSNQINAAEAAVLIAGLHNEYPESYVCVELNDLRGVGQDIANRLQTDYEVEYLHYNEDRDGRRTNQKGLVLDRGNKANGCMYLKGLIESHKLQINDEQIINELFRFINNGGKWQATTGYNDDLVMCLIAFAILDETSTYFAQWKSSDVGDDEIMQISWRTNGMEDQWDGYENSPQWQFNGHKRDFGIMTSGVWE